jgi:hypothetical protein
MWQSLLMIVVVACAAVYVVWTFLPALRRQQLLDALAALGLLRAAAARHRAKLTASGCAGCAAHSGHSMRVRR